jgi:hypothetical protein
MVFFRASRAPILCARAICWCISLFLAPCALAEICKYVDADGNMHYTNVAPEKGWKKLSCGMGDDQRGDRSAKASPSPAGFPKVDADTQRARDALRRKVLSDELDTEEKLLVEARVAYGDGAPAPLAEERTLRSTPTGWERGRRSTFTKEYRSIAQGTVGVEVILVPGAAAGLAIAAAHAFGCGSEASASPGKSG